MASDSFRSVDIERTGLGRYVARNVRGGALSFGTGEPGDPDFTPVELLLTAIAGCTAADVDFIVSRRSEPVVFTVRASGDKVRDETGGNRMVNLAVEFTVAFADGEEGDAARQALPRSVRMSHDRLCVVSRTVELGGPISTTIARGAAGGGPQDTPVTGPAANPASSEPASTDVASADPASTDVASADPARADPGVSPAASA